MNVRYPLTALALAALALPSLAADAPPALRKIDFENAPVGQAPEGFDFARTGGGAVGKWVVREDETNKANHVLVQESADKTDYRFPLAVARDGSYGDVKLSVRARPISGDVDQGFGLVWRYQDENNYYITRCNADEDNCTIYHTVKGNRVAIKNHPIKVATKSWHDLSVEAKGNHLVVTYDGQVVLDVHDDTFKDPGRVGLWTKADSVIAFDDFTIEGK